MDIDYGLAYDFIDDRDGRPLQLRFRCDWMPADSANTVEATGQLIAMIADPLRTDYADIVTISRPHVQCADIEKALDDWQTWAMLTDETVNLAEIRRRIHAAGLD